MNALPSEITADIEFNVKWQPIQEKFYDLYESGLATKCGLGGARGGTKSHTLRSLMLLRRLQYADTGGFIIRRTTDDLRDNHIRPLLHEYPVLREMYLKQEKIIHLPNGSWIRFISSDNYDEIFRLVGKEAADIMVDQSEQFTQEQLEFITTLNRCTTNFDITPKMAFGFNPGDVGHTYHKRIFIERDFRDNENPDDYAFLQAFGWDNVQWSRQALVQDRLTVEDYFSWNSEKRFQYFIKRSPYGGILWALPESKRKAQLYGSFDIFEGQFFEMWRKDLHIIEPMTPSGDWPMVGVIDYGERTVLEVQCRDYEGNVINFCEVYTEQQTPTDRFNAMCDVLIERKIWNLRIKYDTNMDISLKYYTGYDKTPAQIAREVFEERFRAAGLEDKAPTLQVVTKLGTDKFNFRVACNEAMKEYLSWSRDKEGKLVKKPRFRVTTDCIHLRKTLPELVHDKSSQDGLDFDSKIGCDDPYDAAKMALMDMYKPVKVEKKRISTHEEWLEEYVFKPTREKALHTQRNPDTI